jgi:hypothetical protein
MSTSEIQKPQSYTQDEIQQILYLAIAHKTDNEELSREQLGEIAAELGINQESLAIAEQTWLKQKSVTTKQQEFNNYRKGKLQQKAVKYLIVNTFLMSLNLISSHLLSWSLYIVILWGLGLALDAWKTYQTKGEAYETAFQNWQRQSEIKRSIGTLWDKLQQYLQRIIEN